MPTSTSSNEKESIQNVQRYLRQLSYHNPQINPVPIDGIWESDTERAMRAFQSENGLPVTGTADKTTFDMLYQAYLNSVATYSKPNALAIFPRLPVDYSLGLGDSFFLVQILQYILEELSVIYDELENLKRTGVYDSETETAVRYFQEKNQIPNNGRVNKETWNKLVEEFSVYNLDQRQ